MDFELNEEQKLLRDTTREVFSRAYDTEKRNKIVAGDLGWSTDVWKQLAEVGLLGLTFSEDDGGMDAGPVEIMAVMTEVGRRLAPEPILDAVLVPGGLISELGSKDQRARLLPSVAEGSTLLAFAHNESGSRWPNIVVKTTATEDGGSFSLTGVKNPVPHGGSADTIVVSAVLASGETALFLVDGDATGLVRKSYVTHDGLRAAQLEFTDVAAEPLGEASGAADAIERSEVRAQAALCAEAFGAMEEALRLTTDYLKARKQFGVPLAKFQALTFRAADLYVLLELSRSMVLYATMSLSDGVVDPLVASRSKLQVSRSSRKLGQEAIQLHGGIGVTAEYPVGHYVSRLVAIEHTLGGADEHLRILSANVG